MGNQPAAPQAGRGEPSHQDESFHGGVRHAVAAGARPDRRTRFVTYETEVRSGGEQPGAHADELVQSPAVHDDDGAEAPARMAPGRPSYLPVRWQRRITEERQRPQLPAAGRRPPHAAVPGERRATPVVSAGARAPRTKFGTLTDDDDGAFQHERPPQPQPRHRRSKMRQPTALCWMECCLFCLLVIAVSVAVLVVYLAYQPKSPQLRVTSATLNAGHVNKLGGGAGVLNANLTVLAAISNPNTKISIVLRYTQLDLFFEDSVIATQAVWPAPVKEAPGGGVVRSVHLVASNVTMTQEAVFVWQNATAKGGGPVVLQLAGRFHTQLYFGRWFRCRYWANPQCTLWIDPPPSGALRRSQC